MSAWTEPPTLEGGHVTLRPLAPEDRDSLLSASADGRLWELFYTVAPGPETIDYWLANAFRERGEGRGMPFAVLDAGGSVIGSTRYLRMNRAHRRVEIGGTFYAARAQRTGLNTEAKLLLLSYAFDARLRLRAVPHRLVQQALAARHRAARRQAGWRAARPAHHARWTRARHHGLFGAGA
jgi:RimJ/RimL family protein N-acetyltransferase